MEDLMVIQAESRKDVGKKISKKLRKQGKIPAIIYGESKESIAVSIDLQSVKAILKSEKKGNTVIRIHCDDIQVDAMLHEIQYDYLSEKIIHVDLLRVDINKPVNVWVPIIVKGDPIGVKLEDGIFEFITREIKVRCLPTQIPTNYQLNVSDMHAGNSIKAENLELGEGIRLLLESDRVICAVTAKSGAPAGEEVVATEPAVAAAAVA